MRCISCAATGSAPPAAARREAAALSAARRAPPSSSGAQRPRPVRAAPPAGVFFLDAADKAERAAALQRRPQQGPGSGAALAALPPNAGEARGALPAPPPGPPLALPPHYPTVLELIQETRSFKRFNQLIEEMPFLRDDWRSFVNRPWVSGVVAALLSHREGAAMMAGDRHLARAVRGVIQSVDAALTEDDLRWVVGAIDTVDRHSAVYLLLDAAEAAIDAEAVEWIDAVGRAAVTPGRLAAAADVLAAVLTPCAVRRRRERRHGSPDCEYAASATRGAGWGIQARRDARREARRRGVGSPFATLEPAAPAAAEGSLNGGSGGGSGASCGAASPFATLEPAASPFSALDLALLAGSGAGGWHGAVSGSPTSTLDAVPACAVNQLVDALRGFWTKERINGYLDAVEAALPEALPAFESLVSTLAGLPNAQPALLAALDALEAGLPARRVAEVGAALVAGISPERIEYGGRAADALLPPARLERLVVALGQAVTPERIASLPHHAPELARLLPSTAALRHAAAAVARLAGSQRAAEWEVALEEALPPARLAAWAAAAEAAVTPRRTGALIDAAAALAHPKTALLRRALNRPGGGAAPAAAAAPSDPAFEADSVPRVWTRHELLAALRLLDDALTPPTVAGLAAFADRLLEPRRVAAIAAALDRALPPLPDGGGGDGAAAGADAPAGRGAGGAGAGAGAARPLPPLAGGLWRVTVERGVAGRAARALAAALREPAGGGAALRLVDAAAAAPGPGAWLSRLRAAPAAARLAWAFHVNLLLTP
ncbi:hypothetical protein Rsub_00859 [Raphidocelis subcapitata]|uniref:Uncharacterized protein n=1 Tax=Raphidocelis subcapitata TaxID=307507 RepID=A0A2V0NT91_9CHLO|nr:hypothetical protein Rsub_00859 [Raphidocelis subcapitata]|eukprot:GBF88147.1 hypothetical protein Rsub_00859 [Raphidocelis subcapitata]